MHPPWMPVGSVAHIDGWCSKGKEMQSFTYMSDDAIDAMLQRVNEIAADGYHMSLNPTDLAQFILALKNAYEHTADMGCEGTDDIDLADDEAGKWAGEFLSSMADQMGIEFI